MFYFWFYVGKTYRKITWKNKNIKISHFFRALNFFAEPGTSLRKYRIRMSPELDIMSPQILEKN